MDEIDSERDRDDERSRRSDNSSRPNRSNATSRRGTEALRDDELHDAPLTTLEDLTVRQRQTLRAIWADPDATQSELAEEFDVTPSTINAHANAVDGFDWNNRVAFVTRLFGERPHPDDGVTGDDPQPTASAIAPSRLDRIEARINELADCIDCTGAESPHLRSELAHKVIQICLTSPEISADEELEIIRALVR